jgi:hypothetical protein
MYKTYLILLVALLASLSIQAQQNSTVISQQSNPLIPDQIADPSIVSFDGTFYLYGTTDIDQGLKKMGPPVVWKSSDFVNWSFEGILDLGIDWDKSYPFTDKAGKAQEGYFRYWAPGKVIKKDNRFYLYVTIVKPDEQLGTYVLTAERPEGPFRFTNGTGLFFNEPAKAAGETKPLIDDIDGDPFVDEDGQAYIYWRRRKAAAMGADFISLTGKIVDIPTKFKGYSEGPGMFKRKGIYYYFYTLSGNASYSNAYMISRTSPLGPFEEPKGKNVFIYSAPDQHIWGPGHGNVFHLPGTDQYYFVYLEYGEGGTTRQVYINRMYFNNDGTIKPISPDPYGVGRFGKGRPQKKLNIATGATITASSFRLSKSVLGTISANEDDKLINPGLPVRKVQRTADYQPSNAADESKATRWRANERDPSPWIQFDLGKIVKVSSCEMQFVLPVYGHAWVLEKSVDGQVWDTCAEQKEVAVRSPHIAAKPGKARFLRLRITKGEPGLWEMKIY